MMVTANVRPHIVDHIRLHDLNRTVTFTPRTHKLPLQLFEPGDSVFKSLCLEVEAQGIGELGQNPRMGSNTLSIPEEVFERLKNAVSDWERFAGHSNDWDGEGAFGPTDNAKATSAVLIFASLTATLGEPARWNNPIAILPTADGGALLEWEHGAQAIEIYVTPSGQLRMLKLFDEEREHLTPHDEAESVWTIAEEIGQLLSQAG